MADSEKDSAGSSNNKTPGKTPSRTMTKGRPAVVKKVGTPVKHSMKRTLKK